MSDNGVLGIITSNRFMCTKSGKSVREYIAKNYSIERVWDLGDTKFFDAAVLPCVLKLKKTLNKKNSVLFTSTYTKNTEYKNLKKLNTVTELLNSNKVVNYKGKTFEVKTGNLLIDSSDPGMVWTLKNEEYLNALEKISSNTWKKFKDIGKT